VVNDALPLISVTTPSEVVPSLKVTLPAGTAMAGGTGVTVAVSVTDCPTLDGFGVTASVVEDAGTLTTLCVTATDVLLWKSALPL